MEDKSSTERESKKCHRSDGAGSRTTRSAPWANGVWHMGCCAMGKGSVLTPWPASSYQRCTGLGSECNIPNSDSLREEGEVLHLLPPNQSYFTESGIAMTSAVLAWRMDSSTGLQQHHPQQLPLPALGSSALHTHKLREQQSVGPCLPALQGLHLGNTHCSQPWHAVLGSWMLLCCAMLSSLCPITSCDVTAAARSAAAPAVLVHICTVLLGTQQPCTHPCPTVRVLQGFQFICIKLSYILLHPI